MDVDIDRLCRHVHVHVHVRIHIHIHYTYTYTYPFYVHLYWLADQKHLAAILQVESLAEILSTWCSRSRNRPREGSLAEVMNVSFVILDTWCLEGCGQIKLQGMVTSRYPGGTVSCSASRADPAEQPRAYSDWKTTLWRSIEIKFNCCWVPTYISQNQSSVPTHCSIRLATATHLSQALCQHAEVLHGMAAWQIGGVFCLQHQEHLFQWIQGGAQGSMGRNPTACPCPVQRKLIDLSSWPARQAVARNRSFFWAMPYAHLRGRASFVTCPEHLSPMYWLPGRIHWMICKEQRYEKTLRAECFQQGFGYGFESE